jgi:hypothetical protein
MIASKQTKDNNFLEKSLIHLFYMCFLFTTQKQNFWVVTTIIRIDQVKLYRGGSRLG